VNIRNEGTNALIFTETSDDIHDLIPTMIEDIKNEELSQNVMRGLQGGRQSKYESTVKMLMDVHIKLRRERKIIERTIFLLNRWAKQFYSSALKVRLFLKNAQTVTRYGQFLNDVQSITKTGAGVSLFDRQQIILANKTLDDMQQKLQLQVSSVEDARITSKPSGQDINTAPAPPAPATVPIYNKYLPSMQGAYVEDLTNPSNKTPPLMKDIFSVKSFVFDGTLSSKFMHNAMLSMLKSSKFRLTDPKSLEIKILSVGLPIGFSSHLQEKVNLSQVTVGAFKQREADIIKIRAFKQDVEYDSVVFKPLEFIFELSRFVSPTQSPADISTLAEDPNLDASSIFEQFLQYIRTADYASGEKGLDIAKAREVGSLDSATNVANELSAGKYVNILQPNERNELRYNHIISHLLNQYIRFTIGIDFRESNFLLESVSVPENIQKSVSSELNSLLSAIDADEGMRAFVRLFATKTIVSDGKAEFSRILTPKRYERIFNIPIIPDEFEIDQDKTLSTEAGDYQLQLLQELGVVSVVDAGGRKMMFLKRRNRDNIALERFFVAIATHDDVGFV